MLTALTGTRDLFLDILFVVYERIMALKPKNVRDEGISEREMKGKSLDKESEEFKLRN